MRYPAVDLDAPYLMQVRVAQGPVTALGTLTLCSHLLPD